MRGKVGSKVRRESPAKKRTTGGRRGTGGSGFSTRTFGAGTLFGAALTLALIYGPAIVPAFVGKTQAQAPTAQPTQPKLTYEFMNLLPNEEVVTDVTPFVAPADALPTDVAASSGRKPPATPSERATSERAVSGRAGSAKEYLLQAASFRNRDEADAMRAELLLEGMTAAVSAVSSPAGVAWHRVMVGPFPNQAEMERTLTRLRSKDISALPIARAR